MSLTYEQWVALRNKHSSHVNAYESRLNYLAGKYSMSGVEDYLASLAKMVGRDEAYEIISDWQDGVEWRELSGTY